MARMAAVGGMTATMKLMKRSGSAPPGSFNGPSGAFICARNMRVERVVQAGAKTFGIRAEIRNGDDHDHRGKDRGPHHDASDGVPFERLLMSVAGRGHGSCEHREIAEPPGGDAGVGEKAEEENGAEARRRG